MAAKQPANLSISDEGRNMLREMASKFEPDSDYCAIHRLFGGRQIRERDSVDAWLIHGVDCLTEHLQKMEKLHVHEKVFWI